MMPLHRHNLPHLNGPLYVTDAGLETTMIFRKGIALPEFAAFILLKDEAGTQALDEYFREFIDIAARHRTGLLLETVTWRANRDWGAKLGYSANALADVQKRAVDHALRMRKDATDSGVATVISGNIGPRADGYVPGNLMTIQEAADYHAPQIRQFAQTEADMVGAFTINYVEEGIGIALAARDAKMPLALSFTVETDGRLPTGQTLREAIEQTDDATGKSPAYYMVNCAHPLHVVPGLTPLGEWLTRIRGLRVNASTKSHAELNEATTLDDRNPNELGRQCRELRPQLGSLAVLGGCCGTDARHVEAMCRAHLA